jgi:hypothetical protein
VLGLIRPSLSNSHISHFLSSAHFSLPSGLVWGISSTNLLSLSLTPRSKANNNCGGVNIIIIHLNYSIQIPLALNYNYFFTSFYFLQLFSSYSGKVSGQFFLRHANLSNLFKTLFLFSIRALSTAILNLSLLLLRE